MAENKWVTGVITRPVPDPTYGSYTVLPSQSLTWFTWKWHPGIGDSELGNHHFQVNHVQLGECNPIYNWHLVTGFIGTQLGVVVAFFSDAVRMRGPKNQDENPFLRDGKAGHFPLNHGKRWFNFGIPQLKTLKTRWWCGVHNSELHLDVRGLSKRNLPRSGCWRLAGWRKSTLRLANLTSGWASLPVRDILSTNQFLWGESIAMIRDVGDDHESLIQLLDGGFKYFLYFHPYLGKISNLTSIFFRWVGSTTNQVRWT